MKVKKKGDDPNFEIPPSMIDVTFLLLIFFVVSARFKAPEGNLETHLPKDKGMMNVAHKVLISEVEDIRIRVVKDGIRVKTFINKQVCVDEEDLYKRLSSLHQQFPEKMVVIEGEPKVPFQPIVTAINACVKAGVTKMNFAAPKDVGLTFN
ncbi:MAG: biopolymer transporter ExbD [Planctomycetota bacterium]